MTATEQNICTSSLSYQGLGGLTKNGNGKSNTDCCFSWKRIQILVVIMILSLISTCSLFVCSGDVNLLDIFDTWSLRSKSERLHHNMEKYEYAITTGEAYYKNQRDGRNKFNQFQSAEPTFPCYYGLVPVGSSTFRSAQDGHKFGCGIFDIERAPIVYSIGSCRDTTFEASFLKLRPDARIYVFELVQSEMVPLSERHPNITYVNSGLGYDATLNMKPLAELMETFGHTYIDVLKMDIEEAEYPFLDNESHLLKQIGQLFIEMHKYGDKFDAFSYLDVIEKQDLRMFFKEHNFRWGSGCCAELSYIQRDWRAWNTRTKYEFKT